MSSKWTPGPWKCDGSGVYTLNYRGTNSFSALVQPGFTDAVRFGDDVLDANARLISASPDLYEALKGSDALIQTAQRILAQYIIPDSGISDHEVIGALLECFDGPVQREVQTANQAAILKAEGGGGVNTNEDEARDLLYDGVSAIAKMMDAKDAEIAELKDRIIDLMNGGHCKDCCCARSWVALGVNGNTGKSIVEHIEELIAVNASQKGALSLLCEK